MSRRANLQLARDEELRFGPRGEVRESFAETGRVHMDRWLPFVVLHRSDSPQDSIGRRVALNSPAYLVWSSADDSEAESALDVLLSRLRDRLGPVLLVELHDSAVEPQQEDSPKLPAFDFSIAASGGKNTHAAFEAMRKSVAAITVDLRKPDVSVDKGGQPLLAGTEDCDRLSVTIPLIHRAPGGAIYPQLTHELVAGLIDSLLCSASAFIGAASPGPPPHFRSLGRSAFLTAALHADKKLDSLARSFDFLLSISPINSAEAKSRFLDQGEQQLPEFRYRPLTVDPDSVKRDLYAIDLSILEDLLLEGLLCDKRREIDIQMTMLAARNTRAFKPASLLLYGTVDSKLLDHAHAILASVKPRRSAPKSLDARSVAAMADKLVDHYRSVDPRFEAKVEVRDDVSGLLVSGDKLMISSDSAIASNRIDALLSHEVSVHLLTYFNGATQGLTIFRTGLAGYEGIQEGLGVFAEWAVGGLTPARLRLLAGRVVAVDAMIDGATFIDVYRRLRDDFGFTKGSAFDISARVFRSGGLAKDAIYLKGFAEVMDRVATGSPLDAFWLGKIAPHHVEGIEELLLRGLLHQPVFVPEFLTRKSAQDRIDSIRGDLRFDRLLDPGVNDLLIAFFVNDIEREYENYTTTVLAHTAAGLGHRVCYITPSDFALNPDDTLSVHGRFLPTRKYKSRNDFFDALKDSDAVSIKRLDVTEIDALMLRNDPSIDFQTPWAMEAGILFGREAVRRGVLVLNDPDSLGKAINKLYFQSFPVEARAETLITKHASDIKAFAKAHQGNIILKPLQGSGGSGVFKLDPKNSANLNQMIEAIGRDGYIIAQAYVPAAKKGDIRLFIMNGRPLRVDGKYAALRRVAAKDDIRSNIHAGGKAEGVEIGKTELEVAELIRPKLLADGMFLVGVDIVGDKILEVNVFSPGNLESCSKHAGVDFSEAVIEAVARKVEIKAQYARAFDNRHLAVL